MHFMILCVVNLANLLLLPLLFTSFTLQLSAAEPLKNDSCSVSRPAEVVAVFPTESAIQTSVQSVGANFQFTPQRKAELGSFQLFINGVNVTSKSRFSATRDDLPSLANISLDLGIFQSGKYQAEIRFRTIDGFSNCYRWTFEVKHP